MASSDRRRESRSKASAGRRDAVRASDRSSRGAAIVSALQTIVSRNVDPQQHRDRHGRGVQCRRGQQRHPQTATLLLSVRALDAGVRDLLEQRIRALVQLQAESFGVQARIDYKRDYPVLVNDAVATQAARDVAIDLVGLGT